MLNLNDKGAKLHKGGLIHKKGIPGLLQEGAGCPANLSAGSSEGEGGDGHIILKLPLERRDLKRHTGGQEGIVGP